MINLFGRNTDPEQAARLAIQQHKWGKAIAFYEQKARSGDRDFAVWNLLGDLHMNNKSRQQAVEAWRLALDGYATEGLSENVLGIARKILRRVPEEDVVYLVLARACLELEYHADCLAALRSYVRTARRPSESEIKSLFVKIIESKIHHPHLLEELKTLYADSKVEDVELSARLERFIGARLQKVAEKAEEESLSGLSESRSPEMKRILSTTPPAADGLIILDHRHDDSPLSRTSSADHPVTPSLHTQAPSDYSSDYNAEIEDDSKAASSDGKDHYDLGNVYREMQLWDAAAAEFEQARHDPSLRVRASLALAECLQEKNSLSAALDVLETEGRSGSGSPQERVNLHFQLGITYELLGNFHEALEQFETVLRQNSRHAAAEEKIQALRKRVGVESSS